MTEEIFSRSNLLIRLKPAGRERRRWDLGGLTLSRQDGEPIPGESGLRGDPVCRASGVFPYPLCSHTCPQPDPRPRAAGTAPLQGKSPCHRSVPKGTGGGGAVRAGSDHAELPEPKWVSGRCRELTPGTPGSSPRHPPPRHTEAAGSHGVAQIQQTPLPRQRRLLAKSPPGSEGTGAEGRRQVRQAKRFSQSLRVLPQNSPPRLESASGDLDGRRGHPRRGDGAQSHPPAFPSHPGDILRPGGPRGRGRGPGRGTARG